MSTPTAPEIEIESRPTVLGSEAARSRLGNGSVAVEGLGVRTIRRSTRSVEN